MRDLDERGERLLAIRLLAIAKLLGLHQIPDEPQLLQLAAFVRRQFPDLTEAEVTHAVERWAAGTLAPEAKLFGSLALDWLGTVLSAWRTERLYAIRQAKSEAERHAAALLEPVPVPDAFHDQLVRDYVKTHKALPLIADWDACWRHLMATGELSTFSGTERTAFSSRMLEELETERRTLRLQQRRTDHLPDPSVETIWHAYLRSKRVQEYYLPSKKTYPQIIPTDQNPTAQ